MAEQRKNGGRVYHRSAKPRKSAARTFGESADWSDHDGCEALYANKPADLLKCLRPGQWVKNLLLLAAPFFAFFDRTQQVFADSVRTDRVSLQENLGLAVLAFILLSSGAYVVNDLFDTKRDAANPLKQNRPIASRKVSFGAAIPLALLCLAGGLALSAGIALRTGHWEFLWVCVAYAALQPIYTFGVRRVGELASLVLAAGFVLRAVAGAAVTGVRISPWLLLCVFLVALFVALCKRRSAHFVKALPQPSAADARILDIEIGLCASVTVACYALYTLSTETIAHFGTDRLVYTLPLVLLGIFRYLRLTYGDTSAGTPETALTRDPMMLSTILLWVVTCGVLLATA